MIKPKNRALLPAGLRDVLPGKAAYEAAVTQSLLHTFAAHGYDRVKPPLLEFEDSLLSDLGTDLSSQTFRVMDPVTQRMMGMRPDMTVQVARIAATRMADAPRPLRLSYGGEILRVRGSQLRPDRQFTQAGYELIGCDTPEADAEAIMLAVQALTKAGVETVCVDLTIPPLVPMILAAADLSEDDMHRARNALDHKDAAEVAALPSAVAPILSELLKVCGPFDVAYRQLLTLDLPAECAVWRDRLNAVVTRLRALIPDVNLTLDAVENRGFEYHTGVCYTFFAPGSRHHLGRGGRYGGCAGQEPATGVSLYLHTLMSILPAPQAPARIFIPVSAMNTQVLESLQEQGWVTVSAVSPCENLVDEAVRLGCTHLYQDGRPCPVDGSE
jgi:ATP phosphoribosyltransferase regulatory subunit